MSCNLSGSPGERLPTGWCASSAKVAMLAAARAMAAGELEERVAGKGASCRSAGIIDFLSL
jgi:hypothetical protein